MEVFVSILDCQKKSCHGRKLWVHTKGGRRGIYVALLIIILMTISLIKAQAADKEHHQLINCDVHNNACIQELSGSKIILDIHPKPVKAMADLRFRLTVTGGLHGAVPFIDLQMPGMTMGPNKVNLKHLGDGVYEGRGIIVRCPSGKRIWKATVTVPDMGTVEYIFDVIY